MQNLCLKKFKQQLTPLDASPPSAAVIYLINILNMETFVSKQSLL